MYYIGIDLGTSAVKLLLMEESGKICNIVSKEYPLHFPNPGWSEQNPEDWWKQSLEGMKELTAECDKNQVAGISFGGQMHGLVILDENDEVIRPAILWNDGRTQKQTEYLNQVIGKDNLSAYTANIAFAGFTAPKILWVKENEPENFKKIRKIMLPKDYLAYKLSGIHCCDMSDASGMLLFDVKNRCWSREMLEICGITEEQMPKLFESYETVGTLKDELACKLQIPNTCKIVAGAGDNAAAAVGTGTVGDGRCNISLGTSGTIFISSKEFGVDPNNALHAFAHADGNYHLMGCMLSAASCNKWWMDEIIGTKDYGKEQAAIDKLGENKVYFLPYLKSLGIKIERTKICGGGAKSPLWRRIIANVLNIKVDIIKSEEGPALGGAMLAAVANGEFASVEEAAEKIVEIIDTIEPEPELAAKYEEKYRKFAKIYPTVKDLFKEIV